VECCATYTGSSRNIGLTRDGRTFGDHLFSKDFNRELIHLIYARLPMKNPEMGWYGTKQGDGHKEALKVLVEKCSRL
jgi:hypothetical protein